MPQKIIIEDIAAYPEEASYAVPRGDKLYYVMYGFAATDKHVHVRLEGEGAEAIILGILIGDTASCTVQTLQDHVAPHTTSDLLIRTVLAGNASFSYQGKIVIEKDAQQSNAYQRNENLMVGNRSHVDTKPELEILANDVRCTHGATVGRLDKEPVFYLQSRGLTHPEAEAMLLRGFAEGIVQKIPDPQAQDTLRAYIDEMLMRLTNKQKLK